MNNINILALSERDVRFLGFQKIDSYFTYTLTEKGIVIRPSDSSSPQSCAIVEGACDDPVFFSALSKAGYRYGTLVYSGGTYIGLLHDTPKESLAELVAEYFDNLNQIG